MISQGTGLEKGKVFFYTKSYNQPKKGKCAIVFDESKEQICSTTLWAKDVVKTGWKGALPEKITSHLWC